MVKQLQKPVDVDAAEAELVRQSQEETVRRDREHLKRNVHPSLHEALGLKDEPEAAKELDPEE